MRSCFRPTVRVGCPRFDMRANDLLAAAYRPRHPDPSSWESLSPSAVAQRSNSSGAIRSSAIVVFPASSVPAPTR